MPWLGRWTTSDPIGLQGGLNGYGYCRGDPVGKVDPGGTQDATAASRGEPRLTNEISKQLGPHLQNVGAVQLKDPSVIVTPELRITPSPNMRGARPAPAQSDPAALREAEGRGVIEGSDATQFAKGMWNGPASWVGLPEFESDQHNMGADWLGRETGKNIALWGVAKLVQLGVKGYQAARAVSAAGDDLAAATEKAIDGAIPVPKPPPPTPPPVAPAAPVQQLGLVPVGTGRVATRINLAEGSTRFTPLRATGSPVSAGWRHVLQGHFNRPATNHRSVFSLSPDEVRQLLQSREVVNAPAVALGDGQFVRTVDVGRTVGTSSVSHGGGGERQDSCRLELTRRPSSRRGAVAA